MSIFLHTLKQSLGTIQMEDPSPSYSEWLSEGPSEVILSPSLLPASQASTSGSPVIADSCSSPVPDGLCHNSAFILGTPWD